MTWTHLHDDEARTTDHDQDVPDLRAQAPPCTDCGRRDRVDGEHCEECRPDE